MLKLSTPRAAALMALAGLGVLNAPARASDDLAAPPSAARVAPAGGLAALARGPIAGDRLARLRGGTSVDNRVHADGTVTGNTTSGISTGHNTIADGSFANANGLSTVIQNTGANVLIQNSTIVNVQFK